MDAKYLIPPKSVRPKGSLDVGSISSLFDVSPAPCSLMQLANFNTGSPYQFIPQHTSPDRCCPPNFITHPSHPPDLHSHPRSHSLTHPSNQHRSHHIRLHPKSLPPISNPQEIYRSAPRPKWKFWSTR